MTSGFRPGRNDRLCVKVPPYVPATSLVPTQSTGAPSASIKRARMRVGGAGASAISSASYSVLEIVKLFSPTSNDQPVAGSEVLIVSCPSLPCACHCFSS